MSRYIDAEKLNGYKFALISPYVQKLFHKTIAEAPTEEVQPIVHGRWIKGNNFECYCSKCRGYWNILFTRTMIYCPSCGAKMDGKEVEE